VQVLLSALRGAGAGDRFVAVMTVLAAGIFECKQVDPQNHLE